MAKLSEDVKAFIVERLACFGKPSEVVEAVREEFQITIRRQQVEEYDPEKRCKTPKWIALHKSTREAFLERRAGLAITHKSWRMQQLEDMARAARKSRNYKLAKELLEQAAKEDGDFYVNARANSPSAETEEERVQRMRAQFTAMDAATLGAPAPTTPTGPTLVKSSGAAA
jgi:hypothetical protein